MAACWRTLHCVPSTEVLRGAGMAAELHQRWQCSLGTSMCRLHASLSLLLVD